MRFFFMGPRILGIRPGISFGAEDFGRGRRIQRGPAEPMTGGFVYVVRGDHNMVKVGVTTNPRARLASLRTGSAFPIDYAYLAVTPGDSGAAIEAAAHKLLDKHRCNGEWFDVQPEMAVAAIAGIHRHARRNAMRQVTDIASYGANGKRPPSQPASSIVLN
jgi:hypothetical protein